MKRRCENPNMPNYKYYGAKGIKVCGEWHSFPKFKEWAKANGYVDGLSLDRIDSSRDYEPDNCQWMTLSDNATKSFILPFGFGMWFGDYKPNPKGPLNDIHKKEKTMVSQNRNLSQKLVVEERHTREYFTGNVTAEGLINAEIDTDYGARPLTPSQARFAAKALEDLADCADEKNEE